MSFGGSASAPPLSGEAHHERLDICCNDRRLSGVRTGLYARERIMSGETAREFSDRVTAESLADHYQTGSTLNEYLARAVAERDATTRQDALEEAAKIVAGYHAEDIAWVIRRAAQQPCPARREE